VRKSRAQKERLPIPSPASATLWKAAFASMASVLVRTMRLTTPRARTTPSKIRVPR
jgi:hypothetical protein